METIEKRLQAKMDEVVKSILACVCLQIQQMDAFLETWRTAQLPSSQQPTLVSIQTRRLWREPTPFLRSKEGAYLREFARLAIGCL